MAGIGFELKKLFDKSGLVNKARAFAYSSVVTIGPMLSCIVLVSIIQALLLETNVGFTDRELFMACVVYAFTFSYIVSNIMNLFVTRTVSDFLYLGYKHALLPSFYGSLTVNAVIGGVPALVFLAFVPIPLEVKAPLFLLYMLLLTIWSETVFISAMKNFRMIGYSFIIGAAVALGGVLALLYLAEIRSIPFILGAVDLGFAVTAAMLLVQIERFFRTDKAVSPFSFLAYIRKYPSLIATGTIGALGLYAHQFVQWFGPHGSMIGESFRMAPAYDIAVFYAFLSVVPTMVMFVVALETAFYPKFRSYYQAVLEQGSIADIERAKKEMFQVVLQQLTMIMGIQLFFSIISVALGIRFLPYIGFTSAQIDTFNILVMGFYAYMITSVLLLLLLYFDDRKGTLVLQCAFLAFNTVLTAFSVYLGDMGFSFFIAAFVTLLLTILRLVYLFRNLNYYTFSAQPLIAKEYDNKYTRMLKRSAQEL